MPSSLESLYLKGDTQGAIGELLEHKDTFSPGLFHYNLGTLHVKKENWGVGRYHLEKALQKGLAHGAGWKNLSVVKSRPGIVDLDRSPYWGDRSLSLALQVPAEALFSLSLVFMMAALLALRKNKNRPLPFLLGLAVLPLLLFAFLRAAEEAIVLRDTSVREGPSRIYRENLLLPSGSKVIVGKRKGEWFFIKRPLETVGWAKREDLGIL